MYISNTKRLKHPYTMKSSTKLECHTLQETTDEMDLGVYISNNLKWKNQVDHSVQKANAVLGALRRTFSCWTNDSLKMLYTVFVRSHLEYANSGWCPYLKQDIRAIERVQRRATKMVPELKYLNYTERLRKLGLITLEARRQRGDLIQHFKFAKNANHISWYYLNFLTNSLTASGPACSTRGHNQRIRGQLTKNCPTRSNYFTNRIVNPWNALPPEVISAQSVNAIVTTGT